MKIIKYIGYLLITISIFLLIGNLWDLAEYINFQKNAKEYTATVVDRTETHKRHYHYYADIIEFISENGDSIRKEVQCFVDKKSELKTLNACYEKGETIQILFLPKNESMFLKMYDKFVVLPQKLDFRSLFKVFPTIVFFFVGWIFKRFGRITQEKHSVNI